MNVSEELVTRGVLAMIGSTLGFCRFGPHWVQQPQPSTPMSFIGIVIARLATGLFPFPRIPSSRVAVYYILQQASAILHQGRFMPLPHF